MVKIFGSGSYGKLRAWVTSKIAAHTAIASAHHSKYTDAEVDTIVAAHTAIASAHHSKYTDAEVDTIVAAHTAIASAHHSKYTDAEVDTIVAAHTAIASAHHSKYLDTEAVSAMGAKGDANPLHHDKYTDGEVDAILSVHTAIASAHHSKYLDTEAVAAVAAADDYVKNIGDEMTGNLTIERAINSSSAVKLITKTNDAIAKGSTFNFQKFRTGGCILGDYLGFFALKGETTSGALAYGCYFMASADGPATATYIPGRFIFVVIQGNGALWKPRFNSSKQFDMKDGIIKDPKNLAASALSGTKKLVEIDIDGTPYYYEVYPTKA